MHRYCATINVTIRAPVDKPPAVEDLCALTKEMVASGVEEFFGLVEEMSVTIVSSETLPESPESQ